MAYIVYKSNEDVLLTLADGTVDSASTSIVLVGKNVNNYGQYLNNNFVKLLENFASSNEPTNPLTGQIWYDSTEERLKVYDGVQFDPLFGATISSTPPLSTSTGDLWYDSAAGQLKIYDSHENDIGFDPEWVLIGPPTDKRDGVFGLIPPAVTVYDDITGDPVDLSVLYSYTSPVMIVTSSSFTMSTSSSTVYFAQNTQTHIVNGATIVNDLDVKGNFTVQGGKFVDRNLTAYFNRSSSVNTNTEIASLLSKVFPVTTNTYSTIYYTTGSEAKVICDDNTIRRFYVSEVGGTTDWRADERYFYSGTTSTTSTNVIS